MKENKNISISFTKAKEILDKYRYKPRREWSKEERIFFKICNFIVLSKKRVNKIFSAIQSFGKLNDKSHYNYNEFDILQIKELILENLERNFQKFNKNIKILKDSDIQDLTDHLEKLKDENVRLQMENQRLQFLFNDYLSEDKLSKNRVLNRVLERISNNKRKKSNKDFKIDRKNIKKFVERWEKGLTTNEIGIEMQNENLNMKIGKRKRYNLKSK
tara:strand:- start:116 stop:763 length:648 start_codon:yes stop_codon:yes gene_type:complete